MHVLTHTVEAAEVGGTAHLPVTLWNLHTHTDTHEYNKNLVKLYTNVRTAQLYILYIELNKLSTNSNDISTLRQGGLVKSHSDTHPPTNTCFIPCCGIEKACTIAWRGCRQHSGQHDVNPGRDGRPQCCSLSLTPPPLLGRTWLHTQIQRKISKYYITGLSLSWNV